MNYLCTPFPSFRQHVLILFSLNILLLLDISSSHQCLFTLIHISWYNLYSVMFNCILPSLIYISSSAPSSAESDSGALPFLILYVVLHQKQLCQQHPTQFVAYKRKTKTQKEKKRYCVIKALLLSKSILK